MIMVAAVLISLILIFLFRHLMQQSKKPSGLIGRYMMRIWNHAYIPMAEWAISYLPVVQYDKILDVGVGNGTSSQLLKKKFPNGSVYGIDLSEEAISSAVAHNSEDIHFSIQTIEQTTFASEEFHLVTAFQTHFHWEKLNLALAEIHRILVPNGRLLIACEYSKIQYYLKELAQEEVFEEYLNSVGFRLAEAAEKNGWICYLAEKTADNNC